MQHDTIASRIVHQSVTTTNPEGRDWAMDALRAGAEKKRGSEVYRFRDGSMIYLMGDERLPVEYVGGFH